MEVETAGEDLTLLFWSLPVPVAFTEACVGAVTIPLAINEVPPDLEDTLVLKTDVVVVTVWVEVEIASGDLTLLVAVAVAEVRVEAGIKPVATNELSLNVPLDLEETMAPKVTFLALGPTLDPDPLMWGSIPGIGTGILDWLEGKAPKPAMERELLLVLVLVVLLEVKCARDTLPEVLLFTLD